MSLHLYNSLTRSIEEFKPLVPGKVSLYCCGPTVYYYVHLGNLRAFMFYDLLRRYLKYRGYEVTQVMNITDVDDKIIRDAKKSGKPWREFVRYYEDAFIADLKTLNIELPEIMPHATTEINQMVAIIDKLIKSEHAYRTEKGDIYFRIASFPDYGKLAHLDERTLKSGASGRMTRADEYDKDSASDFALWKAYDPEDGDVFWETSLGKGRPGWHIECSAMAAHYLGPSFDIHCGGIDLIFPHHTNEIAQSECAHGGKTLARWWMHNGHLIIDGKKMSKSLKNFYFLRDLIEKNLDPLAIRFELLKTHYRAQLDFRLDTMVQGAHSYRKFTEFAERLSRAGGGPGWTECEAQIEKTRAQFIARMDDDLNIAEALSVLYDHMSTVNKEIDRLNLANRHQIEGFNNEINTVLGIFPKPTEIALTAELQTLIDQRIEAKKNKDFKRADALRDELLTKGIQVKDTPAGMVWGRAK
jgi:cysteinyl-tRNA synthetase